MGSEMCIRDRAEVLTPVGTLPAPSASEVLELARKGTIFTTDEDVHLLVRRYKPHSGPAAIDTSATVSHMHHDAPMRIYVPILMRPWVMKGCHPDLSCQLSVTRTLALLERFYW